MCVNGVVTLFALDADGESFVRRGEFPAWIYHKERLRNTEKGVYKRDNFDIRVERNILENVKTGDLVFFGKMNSEKPDISKCRRVSAVSDNSFGANPHWHFQAEYEYR